MEVQLITDDLSKLAYFVPNLPRFEIDSEKIWEWWDRVNVPIKRIQKDSRGNGGGFEGEFWDGMTIWQKPGYQKQIVWRVNYQPNDELFGEMNKRIIESLPWYDVQGITLWSNKQRIGAHHDGLPRDLFPSAPRIALLDECKNDTFYLVSKSKYKIITPCLREGPNLFFFNNENYLHGAHAPENGRKVLIRIDGPLVDPEGMKSYINNEIANGAKYEGMD